MNPFLKCSSTVSTGLNSVAGIILIDFIRPLWKRPISDAKETFLMKIIVCIYGSILIAAMYLVDEIGNLLQVHYFIPPIFFDNFLYFSFYIRRP